MNDEQRKLIERYRNMTEAERAAEIKRLYPQAMKEVHPDQGMLGKTPEEIEKATRRAQLLNRIRAEVLKLKRS